MANVNRDWFDWTDDGKRIKVTYKHGEELEGTLALQDSTFDELGGESPVFYLKLDDGNFRSLLMVRSWAFCHGG